MHGSHLLGIPWTLLFPVDCSTHFVTYQTAISDHFLIMLEFSAPLSASRSAIVGHRSRIFTPEIAGLFTAAFMDAQLYVSSAPK